jgi:hypothetical protein
VNVKHIELRSLPDPRFSVDDPLYAPNVITYASIIEQAVRIPLDRQSGATIDEMRRGIRVLDALDHANGSLELEDADWEFLRQKVERMPWSQVDRRFVRFYDDVMSAL